MDSATKRRREQYKSDNDEVDTRSLLLGTCLAFLVSPVAFQFIELLGEHDAFKVRVLVTITTVILALLFSISISHYYPKIPIVTKSFRQSGDVNNPWSPWLSSGEFLSSISKNLFGSETANGSPNNAKRSRYRQNQQGLFSNYHVAGDDPDGRRQSKIDLKYLKPKFIISELMVFWDTTCTVITWGSFYVIGGTIVATEKLAQKIKTKRTRDSGNNLRDSAHNTSSSSFGRFDSFTSGFTSNSGGTQQGPNRKNATRSTERTGSLNKISSWTKKSFASAKKKVTKFTTSSHGVGSVPQLEEPRGLLNTSFLSGSFRSG